MQQHIRQWEGSTMRTNKSFASESRKALSRIDPKALDMLSPQQLDSLISYSYHVPGKYARVIAPLVNRLGSANSYQDLKKQEENIARNFHTTSERTNPGLRTRHNFEINNFISGLKQPTMKFKLPQANIQVPDATSTVHPDLTIVPVQRNTGNE